MRTEYGLSKIIGENVVSKSMFDFQNCPYQMDSPAILHENSNQNEKLKQIQNNESQL